MIFGNARDNLYRSLMKNMAADPGKKLPASLRNDLCFLSAEDPKALALVLQEAFVKPRRVVRASWKLPSRKERQAACRDPIAKLEGIFKALVGAATKNPDLENEALRFRFSLNMLTLQMNAGDPKKYRLK
jgi:hypothetical protein